MNSLMKCSGFGGLARRGGGPPRRLRPGVAASPLADKRVHGAGSFAPSAESAWGAGAAGGAFVAGSDLRNNFRK